MGVVASQRRKSPKKLQRERRIGGSLDVDDLSRVVCYVDLNVEDACRKLRNAGIGKSPREQCIVCF